jgi:hypothetical protein
VSGRTRRNYEFLDFKAWGYERAEIWSYERAEMAARKTQSIDRL